MIQLLTQTSINMSVSQVVILQFQVLSDFQNTGYTEIFLHDNVWAAILNKSTKHNSLNVKGPISYPHDKDSTDDYK